MTSFHNENFFSRWWHNVTHLKDHASPFPQEALVSRFVPTSVWGLWERRVRILLWIKHKGESTCGCWSVHSEMAGQIHCVLSVALKECWPWGKCSVHTDWVKVRVACLELDFLISEHANSIYLLTLQWQLKRPTPQKPSPGHRNSVQAC
jgi:hypothetical protein